ncbi:hypothetical protein LEP1GSC074_0254 [Leptospira noguchii str. Hook]|nr:hypothetical protein LEP1GSC074_0254 [Leptospira noguchii str. Hook]
MLSSFRSNSFGISATIAFAFVMPNSRYFNNRNQIRNTLY